MNSKKLFQILGTAALALTLVTQAEAGRGGGAAPAQGQQANNNGGGGAGGNGNQGGIDLGWCGGKEHCVLVKLAAPGQTGGLQMYSKTDTGGYTRSLSGCPATGGVDNHPDGQRSIKTPGGVYPAKETADQLTYNDRLVGMYSATYFKSFFGTTNRLAIHSGHRAGLNSHGCVRTTSNCASSVKTAADTSGLSMKINIYY